MPHDLWGPIKPFDAEKWERENAPRPRGGPRPGAGRPRTESLSPAELRFLAALLEHLDGDLAESALVGKLRRMADRVALKGR